LLSEQLVDQTIIHYGTKTDSLLHAGGSLVTVRRMRNQTPAAQPAQDQAADADIEPMAAKMKAIERGAKPCKSARSLRLSALFRLSL
jgi:hypothetical protein